MYQRVHVVRQVGVYGYDWFDQRFGPLMLDATPRCGSGEGRVLTTDGRLLLVQNTERLSAG